MDWLRYLLLGVEILVAVLLIGIILLQRSKEQGLGLAFGSGMGEALFGAEAGNVLTKATVILSIVFMLNTIALAKLFSAAPRYKSVMGDVSPPAAAPAQPAPGATPAAVPPSTDLPPMDIPADVGATPMTPATGTDPATPAVPTVPATPAVPEAPPVTTE